MSGAFSPRHAPPFLPSRAGADACRRREVKTRVWAASGAAQLRAEVQLESEGAGWRRGPWGFGKVIQPIASWEQPGAEHVCLPWSSPCPGTDHTAGDGGAEELGWKALPGEARSEPAQPPPPPLSLSWPVVLDLSDLLKRFCVSWDLGIFCLPSYSPFLLFTAHPRSSRIGCPPSPPFTILGTSHSSTYSSKSSRCSACLSMATVSPSLPRSLPLAAQFCG